MFSLLPLLGLLTYYIQSESKVAIAGCEDRARKTYISNQDFNKWVAWKYEPGQKSQVDALGRIERVLTKHVEETAP